MPVATITLESSNGDSVIISDSNDDYLEDDIILDTNPDGLYDVGFTVSTVSGAFEVGGRAVDENIPIRHPILPFWLTQASRPRFQRLWGTPGNLQTVKCTWDGPSGPRWLFLKLAKEISYTTDGGFDAGMDGIDYHAVVSANAYNPMYEAAEEVQSWTNPGGTFAVTAGAGPTLNLTFGGNTASGIAIAASLAAVRAAVEALPSVGAGNVTVTGTPGHWQLVFAVAGTLTGSGATVTGGYQVNTGWFEVWNPADQQMWLEWEFDPATQWQFPDFGFGQERKWGRAVGADAARMIVTPALSQLLSVMVDPFMDTYVSADLSNAAGLFNGVEPVYAVPPYTGTEDDPILLPVVCNGPVGAKVTLRQRRFWSAESGLEA